jgi:hypothetical protein
LFRTGGRKVLPFLLPITAYTSGVFKELGRNSLQYLMLFVAFPSPTGTIKATYVNIYLIWRTIIFTSPFVLLEIIQQVRPNSF